MTVLGDATQVALSVTPVPVWQATQGTNVLLNNLDLVNTMTVGYTNNINPGSTNGYPIPPLGSIVMDGSKQIWGTAPASTTGYLVVTPNASSPVAAPSQIAAQIALATAAVPIYNVGSTVISGGATINPAPLTPVTISGAGLNGVLIALFTSYEIQLSVTGVAGGTGLLQVKLQWFTNLTDVNPTDEVDWFIKAPLITGATLVTGHGPNRGLYLAITIINPDATHTVTLNSLTVSGSSRNYTCDDWRSNAGLTLGYGGVTPYSNELCIWNGVLIGESTTLARAITLYSGRALFYCDASATGTLTMLVVDWNFNTIAELHPGQNAQVQQEIILPRGQCEVQVTNASSTATGTCDVALIADRV